MMMSGTSLQRRWQGDGLRGTLVLSLVAALTTWMALLSWNGLTVAWGRFMGPLVVIAIVVAVSGALLRWRRVPAPLLVLAQLIVLGVVMSLQLTGAPLPVGGSWLSLQAAFQDAAASAQQYAAPVPRGVPPIDPILILGGAACLLVVDVVVGTMRRVALAGLPLLAIYVIPAGVPDGGGVSWVVFTLTSAGFVADALPSAEPSDRAVGTAAGTGPPQRRPERLRRQQRGAAFLGRRDRGRRDGAGDPRTDLHSPPRPRARRRVRPGRRLARDRQPDDRPAARPDPRPRRRHDHGAHRRPRPSVPPDLGAQPVLRRQVDCRRPDGPTPARRAAPGPGTRSGCADHGV